MITSSLSQVSAKCSSQCEIVADVEFISRRCLATFTDPKNAAPVPASTLIDALRASTTSTGLQPGLSRTSIPPQAHSHRVIPPCLHYRNFLGKQPNATLPAARILRLETHHPSSQRQHHDGVLRLEACGRYSTDAVSVQQNRQYWSSLIRLLN